MMRLAEALLRASIIKSSSMRLSFTGGQVDWITKVSLPRTFSPSSTRISPSLNRRTWANPRGCQRVSQISVASPRFELPAMTTISFNIYQSSGRPGAGTAIYARREKADK